MKPESPDVINSKVLIKENVCSGVKLLLIQGILFA